MTGTVWRWTDQQSSAGLFCSIPGLVLCPHKHPYTWLSAAPFGCTPSPHLHPRLLQSLLSAGDAEGLCRGGHLETNTGPNLQLEELTCICPRVQGQGGLPPSSCGLTEERWATKNIKALGTQHVALCSASIFN